MTLNLHVSLSLPPKRRTLGAVGDPVNGYSRFICEVHVLKPPEIGKVTVFEGRVVPVTIGIGCHIDATASRFHGASIAGLIVGAMGVFVFTVALRHWVGERRKFLEVTRGHNPSVDRSPSAS